MQKFLRNFRPELSFDEEKYWREKVIITEKAVMRNGMETKATKHSRKDETLAPSVKEMFDAAKAQELLVENMPEPPQEDEIEEKLERLKKFNKKFTDKKNENYAKMESQVLKVKADEMNDLKKDKNDNKRSNNVEKMEKDADDYEDVSEHEVSEDETFDVKIKENVNEVCTKSKNKNKCENNEKTRVNESDEEYKAEAEEFNIWYYRRLEERKFAKGDNKTAKKLYDKVDPKSSPIGVKDMHDDLMYMQVPSGFGKKDEAGKVTEVPAIVALLQAIFAILLVSGKTLHEQSLLIARLSQLLRPSLLNQLQPEAPLSPTSLCSCRAESKVCCEVTTAFIGKVSGMADKVNTGVVWTTQLFGAVSCAKEKIVRTVNLIGRVRLQPPLRIIE